MIARRNLILGLVLVSVLIIVALVAIVVDRSSPGAAPPSGGIRQEDNVSEFVLPVTAQSPGGYGGIAWDRTDDAFWTVTDNGHGKFVTPTLLLVEYTLKSGQSPTILRSVPLTYNGSVMTGRRMDPQDVVVARDGSLWVLDADRPWLLHVARNGTIFARLPLPAAWKGATTGFGPEGMALDTDERTLFAALQAPLPGDDPSQIRIASVDITTGATVEHRYPLSSASGSDYVSGLQALRDGQLLVLEHGKLGPGVPIKAIFSVRLPPSPGLLEKRLVFDLERNGYSLKKPEGITLTDDGRLAIVNDNDFGASDPASVVWLVTGLPLP